MINIGKQVLTLVFMTILGTLVFTEGNVEEVETKVIVTKASEFWYE